MSSDILKNEKLMKLTIALDRIADAIEENNSLKKTELELMKNYIDFEYKKYLNEKDLEKIRNFLQKNQ